MSKILEEHQKVILHTISRNLTIKKDRISLGLAHSSLAFGLHVLYCVYCLSIALDLTHSHLVLQSHVMLSWLLF